MNFSLLFSLLIATQSPSISPDPRSIAIDEYRQGLSLRADSLSARVHFRLAAMEFEKAAEAANTAELYRLAAQAWYLAGEPGIAIATYRRGLAIEPYNRDLLQGLKFARDRVEYPRFGELAELHKDKSSDSILANIHPDRLYVLAVAMYAIGWYWLLRAWWDQNRRPLIFGLILIAISSLFGMWIYREDRDWRAQWSDPIAVLTKPADLRTGNNDEYPKRFETPLPTGLEMKITHERGGWFQVEIASGIRGWIPQNVAMGSRPN